MSLIDRLLAILPFGKEREKVEYYFALNISSEELTAALWSIEGSKLQILETASEGCTSGDQITPVADRLLDKVLGNRMIEPDQILFGVPDSWLIDDNLKDEYLKRLRDTVKDLELNPMAYVATSHAIIHFLEKQEGVPTTAILVGFNKHHLEVIVVRAGKLDGAKSISRGDNSGVDIEKALLTFSDVETLPSKILIFGEDENVLEKLKTQLLSFPWMSKLSFLHFPKIEILRGDIEIRSVCFAGASEIKSDVVYIATPTPSSVTKPLTTAKDEQTSVEQTEEDLGFIAGDISKISESVGQGVSESAGQDIGVPEEGLKDTEMPEEGAGELEGEGMTEEEIAEAENFQRSEIIPAPVEQPMVSGRKTKLSAFFSKLPIPSFKRFIPHKLFKMPIVLGLIILVIGILAAYLFLVKAEVAIFVEPQVLEKDTQVTADPAQKEVDEEAKIIPAQPVSTEVSGTQKAKATGNKMIGDPAKGTVNIYNKTNNEKTFSKGTILLGPNNIKFSLDVSVTVASQSAKVSGIDYGTVKAAVTAVEVGADGNIASGSKLTFSNFSESEYAVEAEGNFSGGTSKEVTVVSEADQKKLLAALASDLRREAKEKLQEQMLGKKVLEEGLSEQIIKKNYSKNINDQADEFSLNLTIKFSGLVFDEQDLKLIVSKLITTDIPEGFELDLEETETQADVSKLENDKLVFLARFKAKVIPKLDTSEIKTKIKGKTFSQVNNILKSYDGVLTSEIKLVPSLPAFLQIMPLLERNISISVGLK